jgi:hypothetical protein
LVGKQLRKLPSNRTTWKTWRKRHPDTLVLSTETGYYRDYSRDPYAGYYRAGTIWFPVGEVRKDLSPKERVIGIEVKNETRAYPLAQLQKKAERFPTFMSIGLPGRLFILIPRYTKVGSDFFAAYEIPDSKNQIIRFQCSVFRFQLLCFFSDT